MFNSGKKRPGKKDQRESSKDYGVAIAGGKRLYVSLPTRRDLVVDPAGCTESTTSTTDGQRCGGESSKTKTPSSSSDTSEERQGNQSVAYATLSAPVQVQEELEGVRDLSLNDFESLLVSEQINGNKCLEDKIACYLDHTPNRGIRNWEHLACEKEIDAPLDVRLRCKLNSGKNQTKMVLEKVTAEGDKTLKDLMDVLTTMGRNDVKKIITKVVPDAANSSQELVEFIDDNYSTVAEVATMLDQESDVIENWFHLGFKFGIKRESLDEIKYGQFTQNIMDYVYAKKPQLTVGVFYNVIEKLGRKDVLKKLDKFMADDKDKFMKDVIELESDEMRSICVSLNTPNYVVKNWRHLAKSPELEIPTEVYKDCQPDKPKSPTEALLKWIYAQRQDLTIRKFCLAFQNIGRNDIVKFIREYFQSQSPSVTADSS